MVEVHSTMKVAGPAVTTALTVESALSRRDIWPALVRPDQIRHWLGHVTPPLDEIGAEYTLSYLNGSDHRAVGTVIAVTQPNTLEYTWRFNGGPETRVRFTLTPRADGGTTFRFVHEGVPIADAAANAATWHAQFDFLSRWLHDRISFGAFLRERREELMPQYERELALAVNPGERVPADTGAITVIDDAVAGGVQRTIRSTAWA